MGEKKTNQLKDSGAAMPRRRFLQAGLAGSALAATGALGNGEEWVLETDGTNLATVLADPDVDCTRTVSNDIVEICSVRLAASHVFASSSPCGCRAHGRAYCGAHGRADGRAHGRAAGPAQGRADGWAYGRARGRAHAADATYTRYAVDAAPLDARAPREPPHARRRRYVNTGHGHRGHAAGPAADAAGGHFVRRRLRELSAFGRSM